MSDQNISQVGVGRVAKRYARAVFLLVQKDADKAATILRALRSVNEVFQIPDAGRVLRSPVMPIDLKKSLLDYALKQAEAPQDVVALVHMVVDAGRVAALPDMAAALQELVDESQGRVRGHLVSAVALPQAEQDAVKAASAKIFNREVVLKHHVDPSILGGFVVRVGQYHIDMSVKTKLDGLARRAAADSLR